jgi:serine/threonine-protein kinase HipA
VNKVKSLVGTTPQGHAGLLVKESQYVWRYDTQDRACEVALGMPLRAATYNGNGNDLPGIFTMNLPEGEQFYRITKRYEKQFAKFDEMAMLSLVGGTQIGRVCLAAEGQAAAPRPTMGLKQILQNRASSELFEHLVNTYLTAGIAGVQPKVLAPDADAPATQATQAKESAHTPDLIIKTGGAEFPCLSQNEYLCMSVARDAGLDVPEFHLSEDGTLFVMRRFDLTPEGTRLGFEDFAVLAQAGYDKLGRYKYKGSYEGLARVLTAYSAQPTLDLEKLFQYVALSCLLRNGDAHLKNFGLLYEHPHAQHSVHLAPVFDVVTTRVYETEDAQTGHLYSDNTLALKMAKTHDYPSRKALEHFGRSVCMVPRPDLVIERIRHSMDAIWKTHANLLPVAFRQRMGGVWDASSFAYSPD